MCSIVARGHVHGVCDDDDIVIIYDDDIVIIYDDDIVIIILIIKIIRIYIASRQATKAPQMLFIALYK